MDKELIIIQAIVVVLYLWGIKKLFQYKLDGDEIVCALFSFSSIIIYPVLFRFFKTLNYLKIKGTLIGSIIVS